MANIPVGNADCTFNEILRGFNENTVKSTIGKDWPKLGIFLDTPLDKMETLKRNVVLGNISTLNALQQILVEWRSRMSDKATLGALLNIVEDIGDWKPLDGILRQLIIMKSKTWSDLDEESKRTALKSKVAYLGKIHTLSALQGSMNNKEFDAFLNMQIDQKNIPKLFRGGVVSLGQVKKLDAETPQHQLPFRTQSQEYWPSELSLPDKNINPPVSIPVKTATRKSNDILKTEPVASMHKFTSNQTSTNFLHHAGSSLDVAKSPQAQKTDFFKTPPATEMQSEPQLTIPDKITYDKSNVLGVGSGGTNVYKGTFGQRDVAVKVISNFKDQSEAENETKVLLLCDKHENIVRYIHSEITSDGFLIALELCQNVTLADWVGEPACIPITIDTLEVLKQATNGLGFLHQPKINIIHRDLKPSNILFLIRGNDVVVKLSDFGISRNISPGRNTRTVTRFGGTSGWTAAEMLEVESILSKTRRSQTRVNIPKMTKKIDIFSLGCIYYFVLTEGEHPFGDNERLRDHLIEMDQNVFDTTKFDQYNLRLQCNLPLLRIMIAKDPNIRPDAEYVLAHPIFWSHKKMINFIDEVSNFVNKPTPQNEALCNSCLDKLEQNYFPKISNGSPDGWFSSLDNTLKTDFTKRYKNHKDKAIKLIRILRNYKHHYHEKDFEPDIKKHMGQMPNDFMVYWLKIFPTLINEMRDAFVDLKDKENFREYF